MPPQPEILPTSLDSAELGGLVEELIERLKRGDTVDAEFLNSNYPNAASKLEAMLPTIRGLVDLSQSSNVELGLAGLVGDGAMAERRLGDYRIIRQIGRGGMGVVYEAEQISLARHVALKVLPLASVLDPRTLQRFKNEAQAAASLDHSHIVDVYGVGCDRGVHYYAMRLINGCTLADVIEELRKQETGDRRQETDKTEAASAVNAKSKIQNLKSASTAPLALLSTVKSGNKTAFFRIVAELGMHVADALAHAHDQGVVHRDIKPSNLMVDGQGKVWITDFGLAHIEANQSLTMTGDLLGTLRYMSPEQALANRAPVDQRSDIYSLGATLYELVTQQPVIAGDDRGAIIQRIANADVVSPRKLNPQIPADLETILLKMLEKDPAGRYGSAGELAEDFRRFIKDQPIAARRPSLARRIVKWSQRHRSVVMALALAALAAVVGMGAVAGWWARERAAQRMIANQTAEEAMVAAGELRRSDKWPEAVAQLQQARKALAGREIDTSVALRIAREIADAEMVVRLQEIRLHAATLEEGEFDFAGANAAYEIAFRGHGIDVAGMSVDAAVTSLAVSPIREELADALTNWSGVRRRLSSTSDKWVVLLEMARRADSDPWRNQLRDVLGSPSIDRSKLTLLLHDASLNRQTPAAVFLLLQLLATQPGHDSLFEEQLRLIEEQHGGDFWVRFGLARYCESQQPPQWDAAARHYSVALGIRPGSAAVHNNLGVALKRQGKVADATAHFRQAMTLAPDFVMPRANLGVALTEQRQFDDAISVLRTAIPLRRNLAIVHRHLAQALIGRGDIDDAIEELRTAIVCGPERASYHYDLGNACYSIGQFGEAIEAYRRSIQLDSKNARAHSNLGAILELVGKREVALAAYQVAVKLEPRYFRGRRNLARCLQRLGRFADGLAELRQGEAMAGTAAEKESYGKLIAEAEELVRIDAELSAAERRELPVVDANRAGGVAQVLYYRRRCADAAPYFVLALESRAPMGDLGPYDAACVSLRAAEEIRESGGKDLDERAASHRRMASHWLEAELRVLQERVTDGKVEERPVTRRTLSQWRIDPDLTSVRDRDAMERLPADEQKTWNNLWKSVDRLLADLQPS